MSQDLQRPFQPSSKPPRRSLPLALTPTRPQRPARTTNVGHTTPTHHSVHIYNLYTALYWPSSTVNLEYIGRPLTGYVAPTPPGVSNTTPGTFAKLSTKIEDLIATISRPLKPHVPRFGRFLLVSTFLEDALRIISQWNDQAEYLSVRLVWFFHLWNL